MGKVTIESLRALVAATNSLRYNPAIDKKTAYFYEKLLMDLRDELAQE